MPSSTPERQEKWIDDRTAMQYLFDRGLRLDRTWYWVTDNDRTLTDEEADAIAYLIEEWDFGGYIHRHLAQLPFHPS